MFTCNNEFDDINLSKNIDKWDMNLEDLLKHEYEHDLWISEIMNEIKNDQWQHKNIMLAECEIWNDQLYYKQKIIVSNFDILQYKILEFMNFYWWFIKNFLKIVQLLMNLIKKTVKFTWNMTCEHTFNDLKKWFMTVLILAHFNSDLKCILEADLSDHAQENMLS